MKRWYLWILLLSLTACNLETSRPRSIPVTEVVIAPAATAVSVIASTDTPGAAPTEALAPLPTLPPQQPSPTPAAMRFAVIGDYGEGGQAEADVAALVHSWAPDFIITVGDNNYPSGAAETIDAHVGQYYHDYIFPYLGSYGPGASENRFFPTIGNHDVDTARAQPYLDYFTLPGNERYYDFTWGPVHFFAINSDSREPDGVSRISVQAQWLQAALAASSAPWQVVYFHHAPYSSGYHGSVDWMRWPFEEWGADVVLSGHDHTYERLQIGGIPYFINGVGGGAIYSFLGLLPESQVRFNDDYGAQLVVVDQTSAYFQFITRTGQVIDTWTIRR